MLISSGFACFCPKLACFDLSLAPGPVQKIKSVERPWYHCCSSEIPEGAGGFNRAPSDRFSSLGWNFNP